MIIENVTKVTEKLEKYIQSTNQSEPLVFIYGENEKNKEREIRPLSISSKSDLLELKELLKSVANKLHNYIEDYAKIKNFDENSDLEGIFYKYMNKFDLKYTESLPLCSDNKTKFDEFTKTKYNNVYFIIELNVDELEEKKLILIKSVKKQYSVRNDHFKNYFSVPLFDQEKTNKIKFIDTQNQLILDDNFEIIAFINRSVEISDTRNTDLEASFFIIRNRKKFEDLYGYHERYERAFTSLSSRFDFIDWSVAKESINMKRNCYAIEHFPQLDKCISQLKIGLMSADENEIKKAFYVKGIDYTVDKENLKITPKNVIVLRSLLKIMVDILSKTCLLNRSMLGEEELIVPQ